LRTADQSGAGKTSSFCADQEEACNASWVRQELLNTFFLLMICQFLFEVQAIAVHETELGDF
jgi:hypothetical protein